MRDLLESAERTLRPHLGPHAHLGGPELIRDGIRNRTYRSTVEGADPPVATLILKEIVREPDRGLSDWASLAFLSGIESMAGMAPRFVAGDPGHRFWLIEDLGGSRSLDELLAGSDPDAVRRAFLALSRQNARMHGETAAREREFDRLLAALPLAEPHGRRVEAERWLAGGEKVLAWLAVVGCPAPAGFDTALRHVAGVYADPGPFLAFTHGDPAPTNNHVAGEAVRLLDFEYGAFRHALYDMTAWEVLCPLPAPLLGEMRAVYQAELARHLPVAADHRAFAEGWATLAAYRAFAMLQWNPPILLEANRSFHEEWTCREALLTALDRLRATTAGHAPLAPIAAAATRLHAALATRWPEHVGALPSWPVFR